MKNRYLLVIVNSLISLFFSACGGGGASSSSNDNTESLCISEGGSWDKDKQICYVNNASTSQQSSSESSSSVFSLESSSSEVFSESSSSSSSVDYSKPLVDSTVYGDWVYVHNTEKKTIDSLTRMNYIVINDNLIRILDSDNSGYLLRSGNANTNVRGFLFNDVGKLRLFTSIIIKNKYDENQIVDVNVDQDGSFVSNELPSGDYELVVTDGADKYTYPIELDQEDENIGNFVIEKSSPSLKATFSHEKEFVYTDNETYIGTVNISNVGTKSAKIVEYNISIQDNEVKNSSTLYRSSLNLDVDSNINIPIEFRFSPMQDNKNDVLVDINILDNNGNIWTDTYTMQVYKEKFDIYFSSASSNIKGYIIMPYTHKAIPINVSNEIVSLPILEKGHPYHLLIANEAQEGETAYVIGINTPGSIKQNEPVEEFEPNEQESDAKTLQMNESVKSYISQGDLDFWKIDTFRGDWQLDIKCKTYANVAMEIPIVINNNSKSIVSQGYGETTHSFQPLSAKVNGENDYFDEVDISIDLYDGYNFESRAWLGNINGKINNYDTGWIDVDLTYQKREYCDGNGISARFYSTSLVDKKDIQWLDEHELGLKSIVEASSYCQNLGGRLPRASEAYYLDKENVKNDYYWIKAKDNDFYSSNYIFNIQDKSVLALDSGPGTAYVICVDKDSLLSF